MGRFWCQSRVPYAERMVVFLSRVLGSALSGMEAFLPTQERLNNVQSRVRMCARRAMRGLATTDRNGRKVSNRNEEVLRYWKMPPPRSRTPC
eukprot:8237838-Pyramimonas_sp.AAC.1